MRDPLILKTLLAITPKPRLASISLSWMHSIVSVGARRRSSSPYKLASNDRLARAEVAVQNSARRLRRLQYEVELKTDSLPDSSSGKWERGDEGGEARDDQFNNLNLSQDIGDQDGHAFELRQLPEPKVKKLSRAQELPRAQLQAQSWSTLFNREPLTLLRGEISPSPKEDERQLSSKPRSKHDDKDEVEAGSQVPPQSRDKPQANSWGALFKAESLPVSGSGIPPVTNADVKPTSSEPLLEVNNDETNGEESQLPPESKETNLTVKKTTGYHDGSVSDARGAFEVPLHVY